MESAHRYRKMMDSEMKENETRKYLTIETRELCYDSHYISDHY